MATSPRAKSPRAKGPAAKGLDEAAAQELIEHTLKLLTNGAQAKKAKPGVDALVELAREAGALADGRRALSIKGISVGPKPEFGGDDDGSVTVIFNQSGPPVNAKGSGHGPLVGYGGSHFTCMLMDLGIFGKQWVCVTF